MHEIVTIQIGAQSNYAGAHFWNAQESYFTYGSEEKSPVNHDIHFRTGIAADGSDTFTPRALIYDAKQAFGSLRQVNALYEIEHRSTDPVQTLREAATVIRQQVIPQHPYQNHLEEPSAPPSISASSVRFWSDYNRVFYHPRSLIQLETTSLAASMAPMQSWDFGLELFEKEDKEHDLLDRDFRFFAEECDQMQGVVVLADTDDAWGGFTKGYVEKLRDELGKGVIWVWALNGTIEEGQLSSRTRMERLRNSLLSLHGIGSQASIYCPLLTQPVKIPPYLSLDSTSRWQTSALQMTGLETLLLPTRLRNATDGYSLLVDICQTFTSRSTRRNILQTDLSINAQEQHVNGIADDQAGNEESHSIDGSSNLSALGISLFPLVSNTSEEVRAHQFSRLFVHRGGNARSADISSEIGFDDGPVFRSYFSELAFPHLTSFPNIYGNTGMSNSLEVKASLEATSTIARWIRDFAGQTRLLPVEEREDISSDLKAWADEYIEGWESDDSEDWE